MALVGSGVSALAIDPPDLYGWSSPKDYQVFQRGSRASGVVVFSGNIHSACTVRYRISGKPLEGALPEGWQALKLEGKTKDDNTIDFNVSVTVPAGGWYSLEVEIGGAVPVHTFTVAHVGVGEVFVIAGQSNSTNFGAEKQTTASGMVASFDGKAWQPANDPQPGVQDRSNGGSFAPAFGDALFEKFKVPIGIASTGAGATSVRQWLPKGARMNNPPTIDAHVKQIERGVWEATGDLFEGLMKRAGALGKNGFRAILWHQGESDAGQARAGYPAFKQISGAQYAEFMRELIKASRVRAGWEIPWITAQATYHSEKDARDDEFRAAQKSLWEKGLAIEGPDTDALGKEFRAGVHFNGKGLQAHGKLWAEKVGVYLGVVGEK